MFLLRRGWSTSAGTTFRLPQFHLNPRQPRIQTTIRYDISLLTLCSRAIRGLLHHLNLSTGGNISFDAFPAFPGKAGSAACRQSEHRTHTTMFITGVNIMTAANDSSRAGRGVRVRS